MTSPKARPSDGWKPQKPRPTAYNLKSKRSRANLPVTTNPYFETVRTGLSIGYRRNANNGTFFGRRYDGKRYEASDTWPADDNSPANGENVFSYDMAVEKILEWNKQREIEESGHIVTTGSYTVKDAVLDYLKDKENEKRKKLYRDKATANAHIIPALGDIELKKLTHGRVKAWRDSLAQAAPRKRTEAGENQAYRDYDPNDPDALRRRQASANRILTLLKAALNHAKTETRRIASDAAWKDVRAYRNVDIGRVRFLSSDEVKKFVPSCDDELFRKLVKGALMTGARYGELTTSLRVEHFNEADANVFIEKSKNGEQRHVYLNPDAVAFFKSITKGRKATELIFLKADGKQWQESEQKRPMDAACEATGIEGVTFHILRHTYASNARMNGMPLDVLQQQLGHKDLRMTMRYAHIGKSHQQEQVTRYAPTFSFAPTIETTA